MDHFSCLYFMVRNIKQSHDLEHNYGQSNVNIWTSSLVIVCKKISVAVYWLGWHVVQLVWPLCHTQVYINKKNQRKIVNKFFTIIFSICFGFSKEPSH